MADRLLLANGSDLLLLANGSDHLLLASSGGATPATASPGAIVVTGASASVPTPAGAAAGSITVTGATVAAVTPPTATPGTVVVTGADVYAYGPTGVAAGSITVTGAFAGVANDQTFNMASAVIGGVAHGPIPADAADAPPIRMSICREDDLSTVVRTFDQSRGRRWIDIANDAGNGQLTVLNTDPDLGDLQELDVIRCDLYGFAAFSFLARKLEPVILNAEDRSRQETTVSGPGHISRFDKATVDPSNGFDAFPVQLDRQFNWRAPEYNDDAWINAVSLCSFADAQDTLWPTRPMGDGFPAISSAAMMWAPGSTYLDAPTGHCYFRNTFTAASTGKVILYCLIDNLGEVYVDGVKVVDVQIGDGYVNVTTAVFEVSAGVHTVAIHAENVTEGSPGGIAFALYDADASGAPVPLSTPLLISDSSWKIVPYPSSPPGMSIGEIILLVIGEWVAAGYVPAISCAFTATLDSGGNPWPVTADVGTKVGTDGFTFLLRELGGTYVELWLEPGSWTLHAWVLGTRGRDTTASIHAPTDITDPTSGNLMDLRGEIQRDPINSLLIRWPGGWHVVEDTADIAARGGKRLRGTLGLGAAPSLEEVERIAAEQLRIFGREREAIEPAHRDDGPTNRPYWAFGNRDRVLVDRDDAGTQELEVVQQISVSEDELGNVTYTPTLNDLMREAQTRHERNLQKMANGTLQGRSDVATPVSSITVPGGPTCCAPPPVTIPQS